MSILVLLNLISMAFEYYNQPVTNENIFNIISTVFATVFSLEMIFKLIGLKQHFFRNMWNVYDLLVTIICLIG